MIILPSPEFVKMLHDSLIEYYSSSKDPDIIMARGYNYEGAIDNTLNEDQIDYFFKQRVKKEPTTHLVTAYIFQSMCAGQGFNDGNKRTALLVAFYTLCWNGYKFIIPDEAVDFTSQLADARVDTDFFKVVDWLKRHSRLSLVNLIRHLLIRFFIDVQDTTSTSAQYFLDMLFLPSMPPYLRFGRKEKSS